LKEEFLYYVWQYQLFSSLNLKNSDGKKIQLKKTGLLNKHAGPDFLNAQLYIDGQLWVGNIEMHVKASDWYLHKHETDPNYDAVILHVVWENDAIIYTKNNEPLITVVIKDFIDGSILNNYNSLLFADKTWIPCENQIQTVDVFLIKNWQERLCFERLEQKSKAIEMLLKESKLDYDAVLFQLLAKNFGLKINGDAFLDFAKAIDFSTVRKVAHDQKRLTALLFGMAGFLETEIESEYYLNLKKEFVYLKHKFNLHPKIKNSFQFFRMRPTNFPTIRIAQLAALFAEHQNLFSKVIHLNNKKDYYKLFSFSIDDFWKEHYTFETTSKKSSKKLTKSFIDLLLINTIVPLKFVYLKNRGELTEGAFLSLIQEVSSEKNGIISKFLDLGISSKNALESQALLQLKNNYCTAKKCLNCAIGNNLLRTNA